MDHVILILKHSVYHQQLIAYYDEPVAIKHIGSNDGIHYPGFVFEAEKNKPFCCSGTLPANDPTGNPNLSSITHPLQICGSKHPELVQLASAMCHWMFADGHACSAKVRIDSLGYRHPGQW